MSQPRNGNRKCDCKHYYANHRMGAYGYEQCQAPGCSCEGVHHKKKRSVRNPEPKAS